MDRAVGHLRNELRQLGIAEDTLVWFTSDNGASPPGCNGGLRGRKATLWEGGIRVPTVIEWPARFPEPAVIDVPCGTVDIYPTLLAIAGIEVPEHPPLDGIDLLPILEERLGERPDPMGFWIYPAPGRVTPSGPLLDALAERLSAGLPGYDPEAEGPINPDRRYPRDERPGHAVWLDHPYKLHRVTERGEFHYLLFDLVADPAEERNLAEAQPQRVARMKAELAAWQGEVIDSLNRTDYADP